MKTPQSNADPRKRKYVSTKLLNNLREIPNPYREPSAWEKNTRNNHDLLKLISKNAQLNPQPLSVTIDSDYTATDFYRPTKLDSTKVQAMRRTQFTPKPQTTKNKPSQTKKKGIIKGFTQIAKRMNTPTLQRSESMTKVQKETKELQDKSEYGTIGLNEIAKLSQEHSSPVNGLSTPNYDHSTQNVTTDVVVSVTSR